MNVFFSTFHLFCVLLFLCPLAPSGAMHNWMAKWGNVFLNEHLNSGSSRALFLCVSTPRIVVVSLQGRWMKRKVNECGEHAEPLWLCVSLIRSWWEAVWGRDGAYYCYGTLRTVHEALLACLFCGQQYTRYKHCKQHSKGNHYSSPKEKKNTTNSAKGSLLFYVIKLKRGERLELFLFHAYFLFPPTRSQQLLLHPPDWIFYSLRALCFFLYVLHSPPSFSISVSSSLSIVSFLGVCVRNLVGGRHEAHSLVSQRELRELNELTLPIL